MSGTQLSYRLVLAALVLAVGVGGARGATKELDRSRYMGLDEVRAGMKGVGRSVFRGTKIEEFQVEVIGVLKTWVGPKLSAIWVRCSGANLEHSGIIRGMSGSPIYLRDGKTGKLRLAGALAYAYSFAKDPLAGVQPIEQMLGIPSVDGKQEPAFAGGGPVRWANAEPVGSMPATRWRRLGLAVEHPMVPAPQAADMNGGMVPALGLPLSCGNLRPVEMKWIRQVFQGSNVVPVAGGAGPGAAAKGVHARLEPGSVLACPIMSGDLNFTASGTVTDVRENAVLGFGHSFFGGGRLEVPLATGMVYGIVANQVISFKMSTFLEVKGSLLADEYTGVVGWRDRKARMVPMTVRVNFPNGRQETYHYAMVHHRIFTAGLVGAGVIRSATAHHDIPALSTVKYSLKARFKGLGELSFKNVGSGFGGVFGSFSLASTFSEPVGTLIDNPLGRNILKDLEAELTVTPGRRDATIEKVYSDRAAYKPGETVAIFVRMRPFRKKPVVSHYGFALPKDLKEGRYRIQVGDGMSYLMDLRHRMPHVFDIKNQRQLLGAFNRVGRVRDDYLYITLKLPRGGLAVRQQEMPDLPGSRRQIYGEPGGVDTYAFTQAVVRKHRLADVVRGSGGLTITVSKRADQ